jgi:hypothetical protein
MWAVSINTTSSIRLETPKIAGSYGFGPKAVGLIYLNSVVAVTLGELFGHFFNDFMTNRYIRKHDGIFRLEARLSTKYIVTFFMISGLVIVGCHSRSNHRCRSTIGVPEPQLPHGDAVGQCCAVVDPRSIPLSLRIFLRWLP